MADIYVDPTWSGTESGTEAQPYNTLSEAQTAAGANARILLKAGTIYRDVLGSGRNWSSTSKNGTTFGSYGTGARPIINGVVGVASASLTNVASDVWSFTVSDAAVVTGVWFNYYGTVKGSAPCAGAYGGGLTEIRTATPANDLASVSSTPNSWAMSATSGAATVRVNIAGTGTTPPADNLIEWGRSVSSGNALVFASSDGITVDGIDFDRINPRFITTADGAAIVIQTSTGSTVTNCRFWDCNDKAVTFTGTTNSGNTISDCTFWGTTSQAPDSQLNWFVSGGRTITGARATRCTFYVSGLYTRSHDVLPPRPTTVSGWGSGYSGLLNPISAHVSSVGTDFVTDVEIADCAYEVDSQFWLQSASTGYPSAPGLVYAVGSRAIVANGVLGDPWAVASYPVRFVRLTVSKGMGSLLAADSSVAFDRCTLNFDAGVSNAQYQSNTGGYGVFGFANLCSNSALLLSGCHVTNTNRATSTNTSAFITGGATSTATANMRLRAVKSNFVDLAVPTTNQIYFLVNSFNMATNTNNRMEFVKCAFVGATDTSGTLTGVNSGAAASYARRFLTNSSWAPARAEIISQLWFSECLYYGMPATGNTVGGWSDNASGVNDATEWLSATRSVGIDPNGVNSPPLFVDVATSAQYQATSPLATARSGTFDTVPGINGLMGNNIGAYGNGNASINKLLAARRTSRSGR